MASYVVVDFETANERRDSPCSIGVVRVDDAAVTSSWRSLIDPEQPFAPMNTYIHGLNARDVAGAPTFPSVFDRLAETAKGAKALVAHYATFDMQVVMASAARYGRPVPELEFSCTWIFGRHWFKGLPSYSLEYLVEHFAICEILGSSNHHEALWDAGAAMVVAEKGLQQYGLATWADAAAHSGVKLGSIGPGYGASLTRLHTGPIRPVRDPNVPADPDNPLNGVTVCFTGALARYTRREAAQAVVNAGGEIDNNVTKHTDLLVVGTQDLRKLEGQQQSAKMRKASKMAASGHHIEVVSERDFYQLLQTG